MPKQLVGGYYAPSVLDVVRMEAVRHAFVSDVPLFCMRLWFGYGNAPVREGAPGAPQSHHGDQLVEDVDQTRRHTTSPSAPQSPKPRPTETAPTSCTPNQRCDNMHPLQWHLRKLAANFIPHEKLHFSMRTLRLARLSHEFARRITRIMERPLLLQVSDAVVELFNDVGGAGIGSSRCPLDTATSPGR